MRRVIALLMKELNSQTIFMSSSDKKNGDTIRTTGMHDQKSDNNGRMCQINNTGRQTTILDLLNFSILLHGLNRLSKYSFCLCVFVTRLCVTEEQQTLIILVDKIPACITKTCLFKYTEKLITEKLKIFRQKIQIFFIFLLKT